jgi:hypothetical protein
LKLIFGSSHVCLGLGSKYFWILLQSNCGASVLDFTPQAGGGPPNVRLNRLNQVRVIVLWSSTHILYGYLVWVRYTRNAKRTWRNLAVQVPPTILFCFGDFSFKHNIIVKVHLYYSTIPVSMLLQ